MEKRMRRRMILAFWRLKKPSSGSPRFKQGISAIFISTGKTHGFLFFFASPLEFASRGIRSGSWILVRFFSLLSRVLTDDRVLINIRIRWLFNSIRAIVVGGLCLVFLLNESWCKVLPLCCDQNSWNVALDLLCDSLLDYRISLDFSGKKNCSFTNTKVLSGNLLLSCWICWS